jgi:hypothetical protein
MSVVEARRRRASALATALLAALVHPAGASFRAIVARPITEPITDAFATAVGRAYPVPSSSAGLVFRYDPETGAFTRETAISGQLFLERPEPVGRGRWHVAASYQWVRLDQFEGHNLRSLHDADILDRKATSVIDFPRFGLGLETHQATVSVGYGVTDDAEVNVTVPIVASRFDVDIEQRGLSGTKALHQSAASTGLGDTFLHGKYRVLDGDALQGAFGLVLRLPTGNKADLRGTGTTDVSPLVYLSTRPIRPSRLVRLQPYLNAGMTLDTSDVGASEGRWGLGLDVGLADRMTLSAAVLTRHALRRIAPAGALSVPRAPNGTERPLFGIRGGRPDIYDASLGGRIDLWRSIVIGFANVILPLNHDGVRADVIPTAGLEVTF